MGLEIQTRYATVAFESAEALRRFNKKLHMGSLGYMLTGKKNETVADEVGNKIDVIVEKAEAVLDCYPDDLKFKIVIRESRAGVREEFERIYRIKKECLAFYTPVENTVFYSSKNTSLQIVAHEIGHAIVENFTVRSLSVTMQELMAQEVQRHITE